MPHCHLKIWTQRVTFETWDIWSSELRQIDIEWKGGLILFHIPAIFVEYFVKTLSRVSTFDTTFVFNFRTKFWLSHNCVVNHFVHRISREFILQLSVKCQFKETTKTSLDLFYLEDMVVVVTEECWVYVRHMERPNDRVVALHVHIFYPISSFNAQMPTWYFLINLMLFNMSYFESQLYHHMRTKKEYQICNMPHDCIVWNLK